jgi:hypothetical protein
MGQQLCDLPSKVHDCLGEAIQILVKGSSIIYDERMWDQLVDILSGIELMLEEPDVTYGQVVLDRVDQLCTLIDLHPWQVMIKDSECFESYCDLYRSMGSIDNESEEEEECASSDSDGWEPRRGYYPKAVVRVLQTWFHDHLDYPYPSDEEKALLCVTTHLTHSQINQWFINARRRYANSLDHPK